MSSVVSLAPVLPRARTGPERELVALRRRVDRVLDDFLAAKSAGAPEPSLRYVVDAIRAASVGGERLRPVFSHCGWVAGGGDPDDPAVERVGAALELFHTFALVHDDVLDGSDTRRGRPSLHRALAGPGEDGARFGVNAAILGGDLCLVWSDELLATAALPSDRLAAAAPLLGAMRTEAVAGRLLDLVEPFDGDRLAHAWRVVGLKAAGYAVERPLQLGARLAGADEPVLRACAGYGRPLGEAFQLRDDLLGVFGDPVRTGRSHLDDLRTGRPSVLMALAWERSSSMGRAVLLDRHGDPHLDEAGAAEVREVVRATGADAAVERLIRTRVDQALAALAAGHFTDPVRRTLADVATLVGTP